MGNVYAVWQEMEKLKLYWFRLVAPSLLKHIGDLEYRYKTILDAYTELTRERNRISLEKHEAQQEARMWKERAEVQNSDAALAVQVIKERMRVQPMPSVLSARDFASRERIRELERDNERLRRLLWPKL